MRRTQLVGSSLFATWWLIAALIKLSYTPHSSKLIVWIFLFIKNKINIFLNAKVSQNYVEFLNLPFITPCIFCIIIIHKNLKYLLSNGVRLWNIPMQDEPTTWLPSSQANGSLLKTLNNIGLFCKTINWPSFNQSAHKKTCSTNLGNTND